MISMILYLAIFFASSLFASHKVPRINIYEPGAYVVRAFYKLHSVLSDSDLVVEMIAEYNDPSGTCHEQGMWLPFLSIMNLRFTLDRSSEQICLKIWPQPYDKHEKYGIGGLDAIHSSIWYSAIKRLAMDLGAQYYGKQHIQRSLNKERAIKQTSSYASIKSLSNAKLQTQDTIGMYPVSMPHNHLRVNIAIQAEKDQKGGGMVVALATFSYKWLTATNRDYATMKFKYTRNGLKVLSQDSPQRFSKWTPWIKKLVQKRIAQYLQFKYYHNHVTKVVKLKQKSSRPQVAHNPTWHHDPNMPPIK